MAGAKTVLNIQMAARPRVGARERNEDDLRTGTHDGIAIAVLSDGAGGHSNGAIASDLVVRFGRGPVMPRSLRRPVSAVLV